MNRAPLAPSDTFARRHLGSNEADVAAMVGQLGYSSLDAVIDATVPAHIRGRRQVAWNRTRSRLPLAQRRCKGVRNSRPMALTQARPPFDNRQRRVVARS